MKKHNEGILKRVEILDKKYNIRYAKTGGRLYNTFKAIYFIAAIWTVIMNFLFLMGEIIMYSGTDNFKEVVDEIITVSIATVIILAVFFLLKFKQHIISAAVVTVSAIFSIFTFARLMEDDTMRFGYKLSFYWRHFVPLLLMVITIAAVTFIALRAAVKLDRACRKAEDNIYTQYHRTVQDMTDEEWDSFLKNYDPREYQKQFLTKNTSDAEDNTNLNAAEDDTTSDLK